MAIFQARIVIPSVQSSTLYLVGYNGDVIDWNGVTLGIPSGWSTMVTNSGLSPNTLYYVYVRANNGSPALELSTTGHSTDANGNETKAGDPTRLLAGMVYTDSQAQFHHDAGHANILNWYNRLPVFFASIAGGVNTSSQTWQELGSLSQNLVEMLTWGYQLGIAESFTMGINGSACLSQAGTRGDIVFGDLALGPNTPCSSWISYTSATGGQMQNVSSTSTWGLPEGHHTLTFWGRTYNNSIASIYVNIFGATNG